MRKQELRAHELIAREILDSELPADGDLVVEMSYALYHEYGEEHDGLSFWEFLGMHMPHVETDLSSIIRDYQKRYGGVNPRIVCRSDLRGDELEVFDVREIQKRQSRHDEIFRTYRLCVEWIEDGGDNYWLAWLPDFGHSACSFPGRTVLEAIRGLEQLAGEVIAYYKKKDLRLPTPTTLSPIVGENVVTEKPPKPKRPKKSLKGNKKW